MSADLKLESSGNYHVVPLASDESTTNTSPLRHINDTTRRDDRQSLLTKYIQAERGLIDRFALYELLIDDHEHLNGVLSSQLQSGYLADSANVNKDSIPQIETRIDQDRRKIITALMKLCTSALKENPNNTEVRDMMISLCLEEGRYEEVKGYFEEELKNPNEFWHGENAYSKKIRAHYGLGFCLYKEGQINKAIEAYQKVLNFAPDLPEAYYSLGCCHNRLGELEDAQKCLEKSKQLKSNSAHTTYLLGRVYIKIGEKILETHKFGEAINYYTKAINLDKKNIYAYCKRVSAYSSCNRQKNATADFKKTRQLIEEYGYDLRYSNEDKQTIMNTLADYQRIQKFSNKLKRVFRRMVKCL